MPDCQLLPPVGKDIDFIFPWSHEQPDEPQSSSHNQNCNERLHAPSPSLSHGPHEMEGAMQLPWKAFSRDKDAGAVAIQLLRDSWCLFKHLRLENWVQQAMGMSPAAVAVFNLYHNRLSYSLFNFLCQFPTEAEKYAVVTKTIQKNDPFLCTTITHTLRCFEGHRHYEDLVLDTGFIILPLKMILSCADKHILRRLAALDVRYDHYRTSPALAQGHEFPVNIDFLLLISRHSAKTIARQLSEDTLREFHRLSAHSVITKDDTLRQLGTRWDRLCRETEEVAALRDLSSKLESLILSLYDLRNFFSLSAILTGASLAGLRLEAVSHLFDFINSDANYRLYRTTLHAEPSLPFLYPLIIDYTRGNKKTLLAVFSFISYHHYLEEALSHRALQT